MKIVVFENEYNSVRGAFDAANLINFDRRLEITQYPSSQNANLHKINEFDVIFIDIDLSSKSELDGYSLIKKLKEIHSRIAQKIVILTGNNKIKQSLDLKHLNSNEFKLIIKPTDFVEITKVIKEIQSASA